MANLSLPFPQAGFREDSRGTKGDIPPITRGTREWVKDNLILLIAGPCGVLALVVYWEPIVEFAN